MTPKLKIITMRDVVPEQVEWLWEPYIPLGKITVIQGDSGDGKTTMATAITSASTSVTVEYAPELSDHRLTTHAFITDASGAIYSAFGPITVAVS